MESYLNLSQKLQVFPFPVDYSLRYFYNYISIYIRKGDLLGLFNSYKCLRYIYEEFNFVVYSLYELFFKNLNKIIK